MKQYESSRLLRDFYLKLENESNAYSSKLLQNYLFDSSSVLKHVEGDLLDLVNYSSESKLNHIIEKIRDNYRAFDRLTEELDEPFLLFVMGEHQIGKSTLTNALIGKSMAEEGVPSNAWKIDMYSGHKGNEKQVEILFKNRESLFLESDDAIGYIKNVEKKINDYKEEIKSRYTLNQKKYSGNENAIKELQKELQKELFRITSDIYEVRWPTEEKGLLKNFTIVDTPGIKQELLGEVIDSTSEYYYKSDGALWIIDSDKLLSKENPGLDDDISCNFPDRKGKVIGVINKIDDVRKKGGEEAVEKVVKEAQRIYGEKFKAIIPVSAKEAINGILENDFELVERSGIDKLKKEIESCFLNRSKQIKVSSKNQGTEMLLDNLISDIKTLREELKDKTSKRHELKQELKTEIENKKNSLLEKISEFIDAYVEDAKTNIENKSTRLFDMEGTSFRKLYVENDIFMIKNLKSGIDNLENEIMESLHQFYRYNLDNLKFTKYDHINEKDLNLKSDDDSNQPDELTENDDFDKCGLTFFSESEIASGGKIDLEPISLSLGSIESRINVLKSMSKKMKLPSLKLKFVSNIEAITSDINEKLSADVESNLNKIYENITNMSEMSFERVYCHPTSVKNAMKIFEDLMRGVEMPSYNISVQDIITGRMIKR